MKCPYCGGGLFYRSYQTSGVWLQLISIKEDGRAEVEDTDTDGLKFKGEPKFLRCGDCKRRVRNPIQV